MIEPRRFAPLMAALGGLLLLQRVVDFWATPGLDFGTAVGRARALAAIFSRPAVPLVSDFLLIGAVVMAGRLQRALGGVHLVGGILLFLAIPVFWFGSAGLAESIGPQEITRFRLLVIRGLILFAGLGAGALAVGRVLVGGARR